MHTSRSVYAAFEVVKPAACLAGRGVDSKPLRVAVWTTTPWTIPANMAVAVNGALEYAVATHPSLQVRDRGSHSISASFT